MTDEVTAPLKRRTWVVELLQGDDLQPYYALQTKAEEALRWREMVNDELQAESTSSAPRRLAGDDKPSPSVERLREANDAARKAGRALDEFAEDADKRSEKVELEHVGRKDWRDLVAAHPPRKVKVMTAEGEEVEIDHKDDADWGVDFSTIGDDLLPKAAVNKERHNADFFDGLSNADWANLVFRAIWLNQSEGFDPKARISSRIDQTLGATSA